MRRQRQEPVKGRRAALRKVAIGTALLAAGSLAGPPLAGAAQQAVQNVLVTNTASNPVPTRATGTTTVGGTVSLADGTTVKLADGSTVALAPGTQVSLADNTVQLANGTTVQLATGTTVALADGTQVTLAAPVQLADGSAVSINNPASSPVPVQVVGGGTAEAERFQKANSVSTSSNCQNLLADVPAGRSVVITDVLFNTDDTARPNAVLWLRQQTSNGFFTHFQQVPLEASGASAPAFSGQLELNAEVTPGSTTAGVLSAALFCVTPAEGDPSTNGSYIVSGHLS